ATALSAPQEDPVRRAVAGAAEALGVDEGFGKVDWVTIDRFPLGRQHSRHSPQEVGGQVGYLHPRQYQKAGVIGHTTDVMTACLGGPAQVAIAWAQVSSGGAPRKERYRARAGVDDKLQLLPHRLGVAEVMMVLQQAVEERLFRRTANLAEAQRR